MPGILSTLAVTLAIVVPAPTVPHYTNRVTGGQRYVLQQFDKAVFRYLEIRRVMQPIDVDCLTADREVIQRVREMRGVAIRDARGVAREGDVFSPEIADLLRGRIDLAFRNHRHNAILLDGLDPAYTEAINPVAVNGSLPWGIAIRLTPSLLAVLPLLPEELEYRLVGRDLVLWDSGVDLIVDILPEALPAR